QRRPFRHRPAFQNTFKFKPKVIMQPRRIMLLNHEFQLGFLLLAHLPRWLCRLPEIPNLSIPSKTHAPIIMTCLFRWERSNSPKIVAIPSLLCFFGVVCRKGKTRQGAEPKRKVP